MNNDAVIQLLKGMSYTNAAAITTSDTGTHNYNALIATVAGVAKCDLVDGSTAVVLPIGAGVPVNYKVTRVYSAGTTATGIVGLNERT